MTDLSRPDATAPPERIDEIAAAAAGVLAAAGRGSLLLWAALPTALLDLRTGGGPAAHLRGRAIRTLVAGFARARGSSLTRVGDVLFAHEGANPAATLGPVIDGWEEQQHRPAEPVTARPRFGPLAAGLRDARQARAAVADALHGPAPHALDRALHAAVRARARAGAALDETAPRLVVVASQHSTSSRAIIGSARERSIPTAYLPHAPVADTYQYRDLPTDFAGLRGEREVAFYRALGVTRPVSVVGNPQAQVDPAARLDPEASVIFAPRPIPLDALRTQIAAVAEAADDVVVSPHPRMRTQARYASVWPAHWTLHDGGTIDLLTEGHPCVIQTSSGVAWEAMAHGVPVIELADPSASSPTPLYPLIAPPHATLCTSAGDLVPAVAAARRSAADPDARAALRGWAAEWCLRTGTEAVEAAVRWIEDCLDGRPAPGPLFDRWPVGVGR